jgi:dephospho-CoA kinase
MRVNVKGISGSGKSTFSRELAERLGVPYLELDAIHHGPNWTEAGAEELQARVREFMAGAPDWWVIGGNYESKLGNLVLGRSWVRHRREWPRKFAREPRVMRLRSVEEARRWLEQQG